jgi:AraC family transcriptional regulator
LRDVRDPTNEHCATLAPHQLHRIDEFLRDFSHGMPTVSRLASALGISREHLSRLFKATTGQSIHAHLAVIRLNRAKEMLSETDIPVKVIAHRLGFSSQSAFSVAFRNETGTSPRQFRHQFSTPI